MTDLMPIIRVRRKRSADPHAAIIMETKKRKDDPLLFSLFKSYNTNQGYHGFSGARVIEFEAESSDQGESRGLQFIGEHTDGTAAPKDDSMGENSSGDVEEAVGYDYYKIYRGSITEPITHWNSDLELRFATEEEQTLLLGNSDSESDCVADDDDDSNDENNWRNDYPEEEDSYNTDDEDFGFNWNEYGPPRNRLDDYELDRMQRRFERFDVEENEEKEGDSGAELYVRRNFFG